MNSTEIGRVTSSDGTSIAFERAGAGPAVILVDAAGNFRGFSPMPQLAEALSQSLTTFTYDRRGKGASTDTLPYAVDREIDDLLALIDLGGGSAFVHGFSSGATLALLAAERGAAIAKLSLLEPPLQVEATPPPPSGLGGEIVKLIITGRRGDAYERWLRGIGVPADMIAGMGNSPPLARSRGHRAHARLRQPHHRLHATRPARRHRHSHPRGRQRRQQRATAQLGPGSSPGPPQRFRPLPARDLARGIR